MAPEPERVLLKLAAERKTASYGKVAERAGFDFSQRQDLFRTLDAINMDFIERDASLPMISALVVTDKGTGVPKLPGKEFFTFAHELGRLSTIDDDVEMIRFWLEEVRKVFDCFGHGNVQGRQENTV